ncbi:MAG: DUF2147 domain-containing protein [Pseudomonadota bacterium]
MTLAAGFSAGSASAQARDIHGLWIDHTGRGAVQIERCGSRLCGKIVWLRKATDRRGRPLRDMLNPRRAKRGKPICGLQIIGGLRRQSDGSWDQGWIYAPDKGETYDVELRMRGRNRLQVKGYLGLKLFNETYVWRRAPQDLKLCTL